jgi:ABC-type transport system involved in cytochrome c biogenesis permease subunit
VFVLFCLITAMLYLYYEARYQTRQMGAFVLLVISAAVGFILWYTFDRGAHEIQPLVPALKSWWMKLHVPANFIGYGSFSMPPCSASPICLCARHLGQPPAEAGSDR